MSDENKKNATKTFSTSKLILDNRTALNITGVEKVIGANESRIQLQVSGSGLTVSGKDLHVSKLDVEQGFIEINGVISELKYSGSAGGGSLLKKIFK